MDLASSGVLIPRSIDNADPNNNDHSLNPNNNRNNNKNDTLSSSSHDASSFPTELQICQGLPSDGLMNTLSPFMTQQLPHFMFATDNDALRIDNSTSTDNNNDDNDNNNNNNNNNMDNQRNNTNTNNQTEGDFVHVDDDIRSHNSQENDNANNSLSPHVCPSQSYRLMPSFTISNSDDGLMSSSNRHLLEVESSRSLLCVYSYPPHPFVLDDPYDDTTVASVIDTIAPGIKVQALRSHPASIALSADERNRSNRRDNSNSHDDAYTTVRQQQQQQILLGCSAIDTNFSKKAMFLYISYESLLGDPKEGYICASIDHYAFVNAPRSENLSHDVVDDAVLNDEEWIWRVTYANGAVVRSGVELSSPQVATIPFGAFVTVKHKMINSMGLSRLMIESIPSKKHMSILYHPNVIQDSSHYHISIKGWISERLNPLSGQSGHIVKSLPFMIPRKYEVCLIDGAVVRSGVELSSRGVRTLTFQETVTIISKVFSEHPADRCVQRLQLAGGMGFISIKLNRRPPRDANVCRFIGDDEDFNCYDPSIFHRKWNQGQDASMTLATRSAPVCANGGTGYNESTGTSAINADHSFISAEDKKCVICLLEERTAVIVHGDTGHIACCLGCARILKARGDKCPVCRLEIDKVVQYFWA